VPPEPLLLGTPAWAARKSTGSAHER
jgi:hypothetical protein